MQYKKYGVIVDKSLTSYNTSVLTSVELFEELNFNRVVVASRKLRGVKNTL